MNQTTQQTLDQGRIDVIQQLHSFNASDVLPPKSQDEGKKAEEKKEVMLVELFVSPFYPDISAYCIEAATKVFDHGIFEEQKHLLTEHQEKKNIINLPENGFHDDTPYNMHLTYGSQGSFFGPAPLQQKEKSVNVYRRKTSHFIAQFNMNPSNLNADIDLGDPISQLEEDVGLSIGGNHPVYYLPTANFNYKIDDPNSLINMNDAFAALGQDE